MSKARLFAEKRLSAAPDDEPAAWVLSDLLKDGLTTLRDGRWAVLVPLEVTSKAGAKLTRLADGSILASGENPSRDSLTMVARPDLAGITGIRLEVLPHPGLRANGLGQHVDFGIFQLTELSATVVPADDRSRTKSIVFAEAVATNAQAGDPLARPLHTISGKSATTWNIRGQIGLRNAIAFATAAPVHAQAGSTWIIRLDCLDDRWQEGVLGRFRLSVTNAPVTLFETSLHKALIEPEWNGRTRLGVVFYLQENWQSAAAALRIAALAPEATGTDLFLLALALHHLGRDDEARGYLETGVAWLRRTTPAALCARWWWKRSLRSSRSAVFRPRHGCFSIRSSRPIRSRGDSVRTVSSASRSAHRWEWRARYHGSPEHTA